MGNMQWVFHKPVIFFCCNKNFTKQGKSYFTHASQGLVDVMTNLKIEGFDNKRLQYQYCVLVYAAIKDTIDLDDIDELPLLNIFSSIYQNDDKLKLSLLMDAVCVLDGTYISKYSINSKPEEIKRPKVSEKYILQHTTIKEAVLISYGIDADILPFCDFRFLQEYIRPKGYIDELNESMVLLFIDYKPLVKRLISMLSIDDITCTGVGRYLKVVALLHRRDEIIQVFFQNIKDVKSKQYTCLLNGLTNFGKNGALVNLHPQLCTEVMVHAGLKVFLAFCRPIGWTDNDTSFVAMETDLLIKTLFKFFGKLKDNGQVSIEDIKEFIRCYSCKEEYEFVNQRYAVGDYVFKYLIVNNFVDVVELLFKHMKQYILQISPIGIKDFLDGLLNEGKRSSIISQYTDFFEDVLFKYGSIPAITNLCRPLSSTVSSQNIIKIDDKLLAGKLSAYLETFHSISTLALRREDGKYFIFLDNRFNEMMFTDKIVLYLSEHGFISKNEKFVQVMYEQFVSDKREQSNDTGSVGNDFLSRTDEATNQEGTEEKCTVNGKRVVFSDYPGDELRVDENGMVIQSQVKVGSVKFCYRDAYESNYRKTYSRLYNFLSDLKYMLHWSTPDTVIGLLKLKFECLLDDIDPERSYSSSDSSDHFDSFD